jgi:hypothetical protein
MKSMAFKERDSNISKIVVDKKIIKQVNSFNYLGNYISYGNQMDTDKIIKYLSENNRNYK